MEIKTRTVQTSLWLGFGMTLLLLVLVAVMGNYQTKQMNASDAWVTHTHEVIATLERVMNELKDAQTGQRGYLLTSNERYLEPYNDSAATRSSVALQKLQTLTADNAYQQANIVVLRGLVNEKLDELEETVVLHRNGKTEEALAVVCTDRGKHSMEQIRKLVGEMQAEEQMLLRQRKLKSQQASNTYTWTVYGSIGLAFILAPVVGYFTSRNVGSAVDQLARSESTFRTICQSLFDGVVLVDSSGLVFEVNDTACRLFERAREELVGEEYRTLFAQSGMTSAANWLAKLADAEDSITTNEHVLNQQRDIRVEISATRIEIQSKECFLLLIHDVTQRRRAEIEKRNLQKRLVQASREAGMSEVVTGMLHNVGNVLNSVNISTNLIAKHQSRIEVGKIRQVAEMLGQNRDSLPRFLSEDRRGKLLPDFIQFFADKLENQMEQTNSEIHVLGEHVSHIANIIADQQSSAKRNGASELLDPTELFEDSLKFMQDNLNSNQVAIVRDYEATIPNCVVFRHEVVQILCNLLSNATDSVVEYRESNREIGCAIYELDNELVFEVSDNGKGIEPEMATRLFQHGFSTSENGHGFGLHYSANVASSMNGCLTAISDGSGAGATFRLQIPISQVRQSRLDQLAMSAGGA